MRLGLAAVTACGIVLGLILWHPWRPDATAPPAVRTIVLITADTLRRDRVGIYGRNALTRTPLTPRMDALAREGQRFDDARSPVPLTLPGHATMFAGLPPAATGVRVNGQGRIPDPAGRGYPLLAERLHEAGWRTAAFVSAAVLASWYGLDQGFETYDDEGLDDLTGHAYSERPGADTVGRALSFVRRLTSEERVFLWVHLFEPHAPYAPQLPPETPAEVRYDAEVAETDRVVGMLLDGLSAAGRGDAAVLLVADHGEALEELGERTHGILLGDAVLRVPFLLRVPGLPAEVREDPVDLADVAPTLAGLAGLGWPDAGADRPGHGRDLLAGPVPTSRIRVAETLYPHHRYRWAQLAAAVGLSGTLVDAGDERVLWLAPAPFMEPQAAPGPAPRAEIRALAEVLRAYRAGERVDLIRGGGVAAGYGHGARVAPFLLSRDNARLANPYGAVHRAHAIDQLALGLDQGRPKREILGALELMDRKDPTNPEIAFWRGRVWTLSAQTAPRSEVARASRERAETAYLDAWERGRRDAGTLYLLVGVNAEGREGSALDRLISLEKELPGDCRLELLKARLLRALEQDEEADKACERARTRCKRPRERQAWKRANEDGTCR